MSSPPPPPRRLLLHTGNIMSRGTGLPTRGPDTASSRSELLSSLKTTLLNYPPPPPPPSPSDDSGTGTGGTLILGPPTAPLPRLKEARDAYDITAKLFYLRSVPGVLREMHTVSAVERTIRELGLGLGLAGGGDSEDGYLDLVIASFPGVTFDADDEEQEQDQDLHEHLETYKHLTALHAAGKIKALGLSEFGSFRLRRFLSALKETETERDGGASARPRVVQINVRDCCVVPKELIRFAKSEGIVLLTHNDGSVGGVVERGDLEGVLGEGQLEIVPQWVVKYTAVVRDRGVVENKGYIVMAEVR
ncbi:hypothetical protein DFH27DRAFT_483828 [Peziza echinospora]|nr:hypothetical protein DFH27DRAFT_483828 [Peziza echinospora]